MSHRFSERRLLWQSAPPESGAVPTPPEAVQQTTEAPQQLDLNVDGFAAFCLQMCNTFAQMSHRMQPMFNQYPQMQQQMWPQMQGVYANMMQGIQQNYYGMVYNLQNYPAMNGTWPNGTFDTSGMYPYANQSYAYPSPWMWYAPPGASPYPGMTPPGSAPEGGQERMLLLQNVRTTMTSLTLRNPQMGVLLNDQTMQVTVQLNGRTHVIPLSGQRPDTVARYLEDQVARFVSGETPGSSPETPDAMRGIPERIERNTAFTVTVTPPTSPMTIIFGEGADARPFVINAAGAIVPAGGAPFTVTRRDGALTITCTQNGTFAFQVGTQTVRRTIAETTAPGFEAMVRGIVLPAGVSIVTVAGRDVTLSFDGLTRTVPIAPGLTTAVAITPFLTMSARELQRRRGFERAWSRVTLPGSITKAYPSYTLVRMSKTGVTRTVDINLAPVGAEPDSGAALETTYTNAIIAAGISLNAPEAPPGSFEAAVASAVLPAGMTFAITPPRSVALTYRGTTRSFNVLEPNSTVKDRLEAAARAFRDEVDRVPTAPAAGFEGFPAAMTIFRTHEFRVAPPASPISFTAVINGTTTVYEVLADGSLKTGGRAVDITTLPFSIGRAGGAVLFTSRTPGRFTFQPAGSPAVTRDVAPEAVRPAALVGLPPRLIKNRATTFSVDPATAAVTVDVTVGATTKRYTIQANGSIALPDADPAPFSATRLMGIITIVPASGSSYLIKNATVEQRLAVADTLEAPAALTALAANDTSRTLLRNRAAEGNRIITDPAAEQRRALTFVKTAPVRPPEYSAGDVTGADAIGPSADDQDFAKRVNALTWGTMGHRIEGRKVHMSYRGWQMTYDASTQTPEGGANSVNTRSSVLFLLRRRALSNQDKFNFYQSVDRCFTRAPRYTSGTTSIEVFKNAGAADWECFGFTRTVDGVAQRWLFSTWDLRGDDGDSSEVTLRRADDPSTQISLHLGDLFTNISTGTPAIKPDVEQAMRRGEAIRASERADSARMRTFDLPRDRPIGYIGLYDAKQNITRNNITNMPRMLAGRGHTFVSSGAPARGVDRDPHAMMEESVRAMTAQGVRDFYISLGVHGSTTGMSFTSADGRTRFPLSPADVGRLVDAFPDCRFTFDVIACHSGGLDPANLRTNLYTELSSAHTGRVTMIVHTKEIVTNIATGVVGGDWSDASSYYSFYLLHFLDQKKPDGSPLHTYGEAHVLADEAVKRTMPGLDPAAIRSGVEGGDRTARMGTRPPLPDMPPRDELA